MTVPELFQLPLSEAAQGLRRGDFSGAELARSYDERLEETEPLLDAFLALKTPSLEARSQQMAAQGGGGCKGSWLWGMPGGIKDNICTADLPTTCGSLSLKGFIPPYTATSVKHLQRAGFLCAGKTNLDEFAMGSSTETSAYGSTSNPWDLTAVPGGSSGGSAAAVAAGQVAFALGSDTGGSVRQPAAFCGIVGLKPTYGLISRYGLVAHASSLDQIGILTRCASDAMHVLNELAHDDERDSTSATGPQEDYADGAFPDLEGIRIGVVEECFELSTQPEVRETVMAALDAMAQGGAVLDACSLPHLPHGLAAYRIISAVEATSNLARFDGVAYGHRGQGDTAQEMIRASRTEGLGDEVKRRILLGNLSLQRSRGMSYYEHAQRVRTLVCRDYGRALDRFDVLVCPTTPTVAFKKGKRADETMGLDQADLFTAPVNLAGLPAVSIPCGVTSGLPVGLQLVASAFAEKELLGIARACERCHPFDREERGPLYRLRR